MLKTMMTHPTTIHVAPISLLKANKVSTQTAHTQLYSYCHRISWLSKSRVCKLYCSFPNRSKQHFYRLYHGSFTLKENADSFFTALLMVYSTQSQMFAQDIKTKMW